MFDSYFKGLVFTFFKVATSEKLPVLSIGRNSIMIE